MKQVNLETDKVFDGCYNADKEIWELVATDKDISEIPTDLSLSQDGETYWDCYLVSAKWLPKQQAYSLIYKDY